MSGWPEPAVLGLENSPVVVRVCWPPMDVEPGVLGRLGKVVSVGGGEWGGEDRPGGEAAWPTRPYW